MIKQLDLAIAALRLNRDEAESQLSTNAPREQAWERILRDSNRAISAIRSALVVCGFPGCDEAPDHEAHGVCMAEDEGGCNCEGKRDYIYCHDFVTQASAPVETLADDPVCWDMAMAALRRTINLNPNQMESIVDAVLVAADAYRLKQREGGK